MKVYAVKTSNCEAWEDYSWDVDSLWPTREAAIDHIESGLGMTRCEKADPAKPYSRDRWHVVTCEYADPDDYDSREEYVAECFDDDGNPIPVFTTEKDAWIAEYDLDLSAPCAHVEIAKSGPMGMLFRYSCCGYEIFERNDHADWVVQNFCPNCGTCVAEDDGPDYRFSPNPADNCGERILHFTLDDEENEERVNVRISELVRCLKHFREAVLCDGGDYEHDMRVIGGHLRVSDGARVDEPDPNRLIGCSGKA